MSYLQATWREFGWARLGWFRLEHWKHEITPDGSWYPIWTFYVGPLVLRRLIHSGYPEF